MINTLKKCSKLSMLQKKIEELTIENNNLKKQLAILQEDNNDLGNLAMNYVFGEPE